MKEVLIALVFVVVPGVLPAQPAPHAAATTYRQLQEWRFDRWVAVAPEGVAFSRDVASWDLRSGRLSLMEPTPDGAVTGLAFEGEGVFRMVVPDRLEVEQLRRFSGRRDLGEGIELPFSRMVLRTAGQWLTELLGEGAPADYSTHPLAQDRHQEWLRLRRQDVDARIVAGLFTPGDEYLWVEMETAAFGWVAWQFEPWDQEEVTLSVLQRAQEFTEVWVSLDRLEDRDARGRPSAVRRAPVAVVHADIAVDLTGHDGREAGSDPASGKFRATMTLDELVTGPQAVQFRLHPWAAVTGVSTPEGATLPVIRSHLGRRFAAIDRKEHDTSLVVVLNRPLETGRQRTLVFEYELRMFNYVSGRSWYPGLGESIEDSHTARLSFTLPPRLEVRAVGRREHQAGGVAEGTVVWVVERPTKVLAFTVGIGFREEVVSLEGVPPVMSFGARTGATFGNMVRNVGVDVANALHFYRWFFDAPIAADRITATRIDSWHGQAFDGLLHLGSYTYERESPGASELFRGHEAAHQYWGHLVGWASYRDQWLSEAFAEYSAMLWIEATMKDGKVFREILDVYTAEQLGTLSSAMSRFARPWPGISGGSPAYAPAPKEFRERIGPIGVGYRASTALAQAGYFVQVYNKGALVLHMLRTLLRNTSGSDELFRAIMQDFLRTHQGGVASTADFAAALARHTNVEWDWFFDQWVFSNDIPTYSWSSVVPRRPDQDGRFVVEVTVAQHDVPAGFRMPVPLRLDYGGGRAGQVLLPVDQPVRTFQIPLPARPVRMELNPDFAVLARVRGR